MEHSLSLIRGALKEISRELDHLERTAQAREKEHQSEIDALKRAEDRAWRVTLLEALKDGEDKDGEASE